MRFKRHQDTETARTTPRQRPPADEPRPPAAAPTAPAEADAPPPDKTPAEADATPPGKMPDEAPGKDVAPPDKAQETTEAAPPEKTPPAADAAPPGEPTGEDHDKTPETGPDKADEAPGGPKQAPAPDKAGAESDPWESFSPHVPAPPGRVERVLDRVVNAVEHVVRHEYFLATLGCLAFAVVMSWPVLRHPTSTFAGGVDRPALSAWQIAWAGHALTHDPGSLLHGNLIPAVRFGYPLSSALLGYAPFGMIGTGLTAAIVRYSIVFVLAFALAALGGYALTRQLGARRLAAVAAAVALAYAPWRLGQVGDLEAISTGGMTLALAMLARGNGWTLRRRPRGSSEPQPAQVQADTEPSDAADPPGAEPSGAADPPGAEPSDPEPSGAADPPGGPRSDPAAPDRPVPEESALDGDWPSLQFRPATVTTPLVRSAAPEPAKPVEPDEAPGSEEASGPGEAPDAEETGTPEEPAAEPDPQPVRRAGWRGRARRRGDARSEGDGAVGGRIGRPRVPFSRVAWVLAGWLVACWQFTLGFNLGVPFAYALLTVVLVATLVGVLRFRMPSLRLLLANGVGVLLFAGTVAGMAFLYHRALASQPDLHVTRRMLAWSSPPVHGLLTAPPESWLWGGAHARPRAALRWAPEMAVLPGFFLCALAVTGLLISSWSILKRIVLLCVVATTAVLAMGTAGPRHGAAGYLLAYWGLPGFTAVRTPSWLIAWTALALALLAAGALTRLGERARTVAAAVRGYTGRVWTRRSFRLALAVPVVLILAEGLPGYRTPAVPELPVEVKRAAAPWLVLPLGAGDDSAAALWSTRRFPRIANTGPASSESVVRFRETALSFPDQESVDLLRELGVRTVIALREPAGKAGYHAVGEGVVDESLTDLGVTVTETKDAIIYRID